MQSLPFGLGHLDWGDWFYGLFAGFIGGGANAVFTGVVLGSTEPEVRPWHVLRLIVALFLLNGVMNMMAFLRTKPLPKFKEVTTSVVRIEQVTPKITTTTQIAETHVEPLDK